jgi:hypothetical protein
MDYRVGTIQIREVALRVGQKPEIEKYLLASDAYLADSRHRRSMAYEGWPNLAERCLLCGEAGCAVYRGYYTRFLFCPEMEFLGKLAVRTAFCRRLSRRFALLPDFLLRYVRASRLSLLRLLECFRASGGALLAAIDAWTEGLGEEFCVSPSTAWTYLKRAALLPP